MDLRNCDNMELMKEFEDNYFDLAICDPPYGIDAGNMQMGKGLNQKWTKDKNWDNEIPTAEYFAELKRVSKKQIVWGGNYFDLPKTGGWIYWNKMRGKDVSFSDGELAWTNFLTTIKQIDCRYDGFIGADANRIHPTQKPVKLYSKVLHKFAEKGMKILDTHLGSGSIAIACHYAGFDLTACEIDTDYYNEAMKRIKNETAQVAISFNH